MKYYELLMKDYTNPVKLDQIGVYPEGDLTEVKFSNKMQ